MMAFPRTHILPTESEVDARPKPARGRKEAPGLLMGVPKQRTNPRHCPETADKPRVLVRNNG